MNTKKTKFIVVSLPRTGTKTLCQMMKILGFSVEHAPGPTYLSFLERNNIDMLADTPMFRPSVIEKLINDDVYKFIYVDKDPQKWVESMNKVGLSNNYNDMHKQYLTDKSTLSVHNIIDYESLAEILNNKKFDNEEAKQKFLEHKSQVINKIPSDRILIYDFTMGWEELCEFTETQPPEVDIPHLNKDTMFDNLV